MRNIFILDAALFTVTFAGTVQADMTIPAGDVGIFNESTPVVQPSAAQLQNYQASVVGRTLRVTPAHHQNAQ